MRLLLFSLASCLFSLTAAAAPPNIVVILTDDQGWGDLSLNGNTNLATPHIDSLAKQGVSFGYFYVSPVCSPTRAEFLTGRYHPRGNIYSTSAGGERLDLDETTIGDVFKKAGYATAAFGKWHNGMQHPYHPNARGFDEFYGFCSGHWAHYFSPGLLEHNGEIVKGEGFLADDFTNKAMAFIEANKEKPFFCYLPYNTPHSPMQVPEAQWKKFADKDLAMRNREPRKENLQHTKAALAMVENIDLNVGRLLAKLDDLNLTENTIVLFFCDNGPNGTRWNGDMKGRKGSTDEGGVRSPLLVRWPAKIKSGSHIHQIAAAIDLLPTLTAFAGITPNPDKHLDGRNLAPLVLGQISAWPDRLIFSHWKGKLSVRNQRFRLDTKGQLYDLTTDPGQRTDLAAKFPKIKNQLQQAAANWREEVLKDFGPAHDDRPFIVGHPDALITQLPARDATTKGGIKRSNRFPNASFFSNWTSLDDRIIWDIDVPADGTFEVDLYYTCPEKDLGSTFELRFSDSALTGKITTAHDPPLVGAAEDRVPRVESYDKDFRVVSLGQITLKKGSAPLTLRALTIPGAQVMDFRLLTLKRIPASPQ